MERKIMTGKLSKQEVLSKLECVEFNINNILRNTIQDTLALAILEQSNDHIKYVIDFIKERE